MSFDAIYPTVKTYRADPAKSPALRQKLLLQKIVIFASIFLIIPLVERNEFKLAWQTGSLNSLWLPAFVAVAVSFMVVSAFRRATKREIELLNSVEIMLGPDFVLRKIKDYPDVEIHRDEITAIKESSAGLRILTSSANRGLRVGIAMEEFEDIRARLAQWTPLIPESQSFWTAPGNLVMVSVPLVALSMGVVLYSTNLWINLAVGIPLLAFLIWAVIRILKTPYLPRATKRPFLIVLIATVAIAGKIIITVLHVRP